MERKSEGESLKRGLPREADENDRVKKERKVTIMGRKRLTKVEKERKERGKRFPSLN